MIATIAVLALVAFGMAIWQREQGRNAANVQLLRANNVTLNLIRGFCSLVAFTAFALLTTPGLTCIFRDYSRKGIHTKIPDWMQSYVLGAVAAGLSAVAAKVPHFVTDG